MLRFRPDMVWRRLLCCFTSVVLISISGCAAEVVRTPTLLQAPSGARGVIELTGQSKLDMGPGNEKLLFTGSRWQHVGVVPQGRVYKSFDTVFSIQGANSHEAYLVIRESAVVGFYLPGERAWSDLGKSVPISYIWRN